jgi:hypothetical protein
MRADRKKTVRAPLSAAPPDPPDQIARAISQATDRLTWEIENQIALLEFFAAHGDDDAGAVALGMRDSYAHLLTHVARIDAHTALLA